MNNKKVFQLTADEFRELVASGTIEGITGFIRAVTQIKAPGQRQITASPVEPTGEDPGANNRKELLPWEICDTPGCPEKVVSDDIYCTKHLKVRKKRGRPKKINPAKAEKKQVPDPEIVNRVSFSKPTKGAFTVKEAAEILNRSTWSIYHDIKNGHLVQEGEGYRKKITIDSVYAFKNKLKDKAQRK